MPAARSAASIPSYGRLNPNRKVPTVQDGELVLWESNACVRYLAARYGAGSLWPEDPARRAMADLWMDWQQTTLLPDMTVVFWGLIRTPEDKRDNGAIEAATKRLGGLWPMLDERLAGRQFVAGDTSPWATSPSAPPATAIMACRSSGRG